LKGGKKKREFSEGSNKERWRRKQSQKEGIGFLLGTMGKEKGPGILERQKEGDGPAKGRGRGGWLGEGQVGEQEAGLPTE